MTMLGLLKTWLYDLFTWSGLLIHIIAFLEPILLKYNLIKMGEANHLVTDEAGATYRLTKYKGKIFPPFGVKRLEGIASVPIRKDDVLLAGYPKTGAHWVHEIMQMLVNRTLRLSKIGKTAGMVDGVPHIILDSVSSPRVLNSHLLYEDLPVQIREKKTKIILTMRCPKDTVVSYYNHVMNLDKFYQYAGTFDDYFKMYMAGELDYGSYFDYVLSWDKVMKSKNDNPILIVEYEKLKEDPLPVVKAIATFLNVPVTDEFAAQLVYESSFNKMKEKRSNSKASWIYRKGQVGDWRNWLSEAQSAQIDQAWKERMQQCTYQPL